MLGISVGDQVEVETAYEAFAGVAEITGTQPGIVNLTTLFGPLISELEHSGDPDPMLNAPKLPLAPARVAKVSTTD
jgi:hypothetical protein